jgi:AraC family transcriptional regulator of adaptative response/methylated-DNA-[protein]-cysteine methyltransferase
MRFSPDAILRSNPVKREFLMSSDYDRIAAAIRFIELGFPHQPTLGEIAAEVGMSPFHFQRLFQRWAGVSPKRFLQFLTVEHAKTLLNQSMNVLDTTYEVGLSSPARLHDHFISLEAVTPGDYKSRGAGLRIRYGKHESPFGQILLAVTERGICWLSFVSGEPHDADLVLLRCFWSGAEFFADDTGTRAVAERIFSRQNNGAGALSLLVKGTNFQVNVWKALLRIPPGNLCSYDQIAGAVGTPSAARAVGQALATNPVGYLIPCHRVIRKVGKPGSYRWGETRKRALIAWEGAGVYRDSGSYLG